MSKVWKYQRKCTERADRNDRSWNEQSSFGRDKEKQGLSLVDYDRLVVETDLLLLQAVFLRKKEEIRFKYSRKQNIF